jgi:hypothetical protein
MGMLFGGTPIVLYGEELGLEQVSLIKKTNFQKMKLKSVVENASFNVMDIG